MGSGIVVLKVLGKRRVLRILVWMPEVHRSWPLWISYNIHHCFEDMWFNCHRAGPQFRHTLDIRVVDAHFRRALSLERLHPVALEDAITKPLCTRADERSRKDSTLGNCLIVFEGKLLWLRDARGGKQFRIAQLGGETFSHNNWR